MILGTWNLEIYASPRSRRGSQQIEALLHHDADVWFLTELHADHTLPGQTLAYAPPRQEAPLIRRKAAIASRWPIETILGGDDPAEGRLCMARLHRPETGESLLAVCSVLPWRGATPHWRELLGQNLTYAEVYTHLLDYVVRRIVQERRPGEAIIWGGDFNQALTGRDYVGTLQGRDELLRATEGFGLQVPTRDLRAKIAAHPAIDYIAIPAAWCVQAPPEVHIPEYNGRPLSDHALSRVHADARRTSHFGGVSTG